MTRFGIDARVHYAVLKIRTEPHVLSLHPETFRLGRAKTLILRSLDECYLARSGKIRAFIKETPAKAAASSGPNSVLIQPGVANTLILIHQKELVLLARAKLEHSSVRSFRRPAEAGSVLTAPSRSELDE